MALNLPREKNSSSLNLLLAENNEEANLRTLFPKPKPRETRIKS